MDSRVVQQSSGFRKRLLTSGAPQPESSCARLRGRGRSGGDVAPLAAKSAVRPAAADVVVQLAHTRVFPTCMWMWSWCCDANSRPGRRCSQDESRTHPHHRTPWAATCWQGQSHCIHTQTSRNRTPYGTTDSTPGPAPDPAGRPRLQPQGDCPSQEGRACRTRCRRPTPGLQRSRAPGPGCGSRWEARLRGRCLCAVSRRHPRWTSSASEEAGRAPPAFAGRRCR